MMLNFVYYVHRLSNSHGSAVSLMIFCHFSRSHVKAPNLTGCGKNHSEMNKLTLKKNGKLTRNGSAIKW